MKTRKHNERAEKLPQGVELAAGADAAPAPTEGLGEEIRQTLQEKVREMLAEWRENPHSEAGQMVYILLCNELATMQGQLSQENIKSVFAEERVRDAFLKTLELQRFKLRQQGLKLHIAVKRANQDADRIDRARSAAVLAQHAIEEGKPVDAHEVCKRIAEIVGLRAAPEGAFESTEGSPPEEQGQ